MHPRYADLFEALCDPDPERADRAFDAILFDRAEALPDLEEVYQTSKRNARLRYLSVQLMGFTEDKRAIPMVIKDLEDGLPGEPMMPSPSMSRPVSTSRRAIIIFL